MADPFGCVLAEAATEDDETLVVECDPLLAPTFDDPRDRIALNTLARLFPDREVAGIHSADLVLGLGTLHCMTQQQPARAGGRRADGYSPAFSRCRSACVQAQMASRSWLESLAEGCSGR